MKYYLDTEFNGYKGELMSLALVREDGRNLYLVYPEPPIMDAWVHENVVPILYSDGGRANGWSIRDAVSGARHIQDFLAGDEAPVIITDWPDDIKYFCQAIITGPGEMIDVPGLTFEMHRVDAYPTTLPGAIQHNALWDAMSLRHLLRADGGV